MGEQASNCYKADIKTKRNEKNNSNEEGFYKHASALSREQRLTENATLTTIISNRFKLLNIYLIEKLPSKNKIDYDELKSKYDVDVKKYVIINK